MGWRCLSAAAIGGPKLEAIVPEPAFRDFSLTPRFAGGALDAG